MMTELIASNYFANLAWDFPRWVWAVRPHPNATPEAQNTSMKLMCCELSLPVQAMYAWPFQPTAAGATPVLP